MHSGDAAPLIGTDDLKIPFWAEAYEAQARASVWTVAGAAPRTMAVLTSFAWRAAPRLTLSALAVELAGAAATALGLLATATVFVQLLAEGPTPERVLAALPALVWVAAVLMVRGLLQAAKGALWAHLTPRIEQRAQDDLFSGLVTVDLLAFDDPDFTSLVERASLRGLYMIQNGSRLAGTLLTAIVSVLAAVVAAGVLHPALAPLVALSALPQAWASLRQAQEGVASFVRRSSHVRRQDVTSHLMSRRDSAAEIRAFTVEQRLTGEHRRITEHLTLEAIRVRNRQNVLATAGQGLAGIGTACGYAALGLMIYRGWLPLALAGTAAVAMRTANQSISNGVFAVSNLFEVGVFIELYRDCLTDIAARRRKPATRELTTDPTVIELRNVSFRYPAQDEDVLHGIDLTLRAGQIVALVGENGSGKSTLAKLITGLYLPREGTVEWDGVSTEHLDSAALHDRVAVVMQDPLRWPVTAANNIRIGRLDRHDPDGSAFDDAGARSGADAVLAGLPRGNDTMLSREFQAGHDLSGGQWQRISVARGIYRDAAVVVADEPTSAMDARAEHAVFSALRELSTDRSDGHPRITVLITHRLANIRTADAIVVLEHGRITEQGTHEQLIAAGGTYQQLFAIQAHAYLT
ncbi:ABC transporter ATP-binding protein [Pseudonocardia spinosispora]|uniref:ABC transporter ATP-binding protein n=1 Tax=Pseudonocardia spinosispora TaxID=103441 RepID=UPI000413B5E0|nr:ABC transporter ATP-binding protein [Pseudonocardia spinosispora]